ncbi:PREDICTED: TRAF family member-associated NF-kappa-B activator [Cyprinodon variegatus]|uniref:TRAF family member-associated NFKB activator n=1 Tax=Cyprinodon variegatus TaxID=28743 RepID=A0A3Q2C8R2_CYPVA|nr:PREDICTED: TRAF family member-associated NF-kappa-B activator [Cyprinodon variegatus]XP_015225911.1 PREDICTED: TRAF family member-associated NF-kappa-B activator [Cyprinodon variegatus]XP_015225912.1 PREDICTED: TRAF family member-associated NF-kappa-B activator [Cyprinodon variegatus]XP_015225913.1 PREDICTED: TRAF family member-associated NF-kappa-B activator [Cyprinodon variegatus]
MERNIGDQLNKAFEAYRQVSIEKDNAQKELKKMKEHYEQYTQELIKQIEDQQRLISDLEAKLSATRHPSGEMKCERCNHLPKASSSYRKIQCSENMATVTGAPKLTVNNSTDYQDMLVAFETIQGKFRQIQDLTAKQKHHLKRFNGSYDASNDQRFSMPIQCTDRTAEAERPFHSTQRPAVNIPHLPASLASRGASQEDRDLVDSLTKLSVKFPPPADSEYDFLNSAPERNIALSVPRKQPLGSPTLPEEEPVELPLPFVYPTSPSHSTSSSPSHESVRGPQQSFWTPELFDLGANQEPPSSSPIKCAFCPDIVPQNLMTSHLYLHFSPNKEAEK